MLSEACLIISGRHRISISETEHEGRYQGNLITSDGAKRLACGEVRRRGPIIILGLFHMLLLLILLSLFLGNMLAWHLMTCRISISLWMSNKVRIPVHLYRISTSEICGAGRGAARDAGGLELGKG